MATLEKLGGLWWGRLGIDRSGGCSRGGFHFSATVPPREGFQCSHLVPPSRSSPGSAAAAAAAVACCRLCWVGRKLRLPVCLRRFFFFFACVSSSCCSISADHSSDGAAAALAICSSSDVVRSPVVAFRFLPCPSTDGCPTPAVAPFPTVCGPIPAPVPAVTVCSAARSSCCSAAAPSVGAASPCRCCNARIRRCVFGAMCLSHRQLPRVIVHAMLVPPSATCPVETWVEPWVGARQGRSAPPVVLPASCRRQSVVRDVLVVLPAIRWCCSIWR